MITYITNTLILLGAFFALVAAIGVVRMPDLFCRMHAATKAGAFGVALILMALCLLAPELRTWIQSLLIIAFFYLTAPIAASRLGRIARLKDAKQWYPQ